MSSPLWTKMLDLAGRTSAADVMSGDTAGAILDLDDEVQENIEQLLDEAEVPAGVFRDHAAAGDYFYALDRVHQSSIETECGDGEICHRRAETLVRWMQTAVEAEQTEVCR